MFVIKLFILLILSQLIHSNEDSTGVWCYDCNSKNNKGCIDEYQKFENECPIHNVNESFSLSPTGCRKIIQIVDNDMTIIRECAYSGDVYTNYINLGSVGIKRIMTQCIEDFCNSKSKIKSEYIFVIILFLLLQIFT
uniref:Protein sleepless n=1 Tax=Parastrongyloides trichosuri TaxID=131310 RepID=A0A0N4ZMQ0_PARTI